VKPFIDFENKTILVSGASSGIGRAVAISLSRVGARLVVMGRDRKRLDQTVKSLENTYHHSICLDLKKFEGIVPAVKECVEKVGRIYGLCHCAGIVDTVPLKNCSPEHVKSLYDINLTAGLELARSVSRRDVIDLSGGSFLFISAVYGLVGMPGQIGYSASKGAVIAAARSMAIELARRRIRVNSLSPGMVRSEMSEKSFELLNTEQIKKIEDAHPLGIGKPDDVARAAVFILDPQNTWITGSNFVVDGGYSAR
jgi:NAD(P)-dependent dehydrogenase (short-subunit alcohol dehydrogenase family)